MSEFDREKERLVRDRIYYAQKAAKEA